MNAAGLSERFESLFGKAPSIYRAPGRVNLIGEHTDHNEGFVMPMAIEFSTWVAIAARQDRRVVIHSESLGDRAEFELDDRVPRGRGHWSDYPRGVALMIERAAHRLSGAEMLVHSEVPIGAGLSSSAALEVATGFALLSNAGLTVDRLELAGLCRRAENDFVGMRCGLMDQFISCFGVAGHALMLDCRSLEYKSLPLPANVAVVVCNTMVKHELASSAYNARRADCDEGVRSLAALLPGVRSLRDVSMTELERFRTELTPEVFRRCRHVISENARVVEAATALEGGDMIRFGALVRASQQSLRDDYQVSCEELDVMADLANETDGVFGARMMGGGFGGCTVNLIQAGRIDSFKQSVAEGYFKITGIAPEIYLCAAAQGAERVQ